MTDWYTENRMGQPPRRSTDVSDATMARRGGRRSVWTALLKVLLVVGMSALSVVFFGICVPFTLVAVKAVRSRGVAGVIYLVAAGLFGLLFGGITSAVSLARSERLVTRYYIVTFSTQAILTLACYVAGVYFDAFLHV
jgi:hypothetical protein